MGTEQGKEKQIYPFAEVSNQAVASENHTTLLE